MSDDVWFYRDGDAELGPNRRSDLANLVRKGLITAATRVRRGAETMWSTAAEALPELFAAPLEASAARGGWSDQKPHPWRRYFARLVDNVVVGGLTWAIISIVAYRISPDQAESFFNAFRGPGGRLLDTLLTLMAAIPGNALMIGLTGLSIGKWIFGVRVLKDGVPMGFLRALRRELSIWLRGMGCGLPLVSLLTLLGARAYLEDHRATPWDRAQGLRVTHRPESAGATILMWCAAILFLLTQVGLYALAAR